MCYCSLSTIVFLFVAHVLFASVIIHLLIIMLSGLKRYLTRLKIESMSDIEWCLLKSPEFHKRGKVLWQNKISLDGLIIWPVSPSTNPFDGQLERPLFPSPRNQKLEILTIHLWEFFRVVNWRHKEVVEREWAESSVKTLRKSSF
jgi:hypothetical protein